MGNIRKGLAMNPHIKDQIISLIDSDNPSNVYNIKIINDLIIVNSLEKILEEPDIKNAINSQHENKSTIVEIMSICKGFEKQSIWEMLFLYTPVIFTVQVLILGAIESYLESSFGIWTLAGPAIWVSIINLMNITFILNKKSFFKRIEKKTLSDSNFYNHILGTNMEIINIIENLIENYSIKEFKTNKVNSLEKLKTHFIQNTFAIAKHEENKLIEDLKKDLCERMWCHEKIFPTTEIKLEDKKINTLSNENMLNFIKEKIK